MSTFDRRRPGTLAEASSSVQATVVGDPRSPAAETRSRYRQDESHFYWGGSSGGLVKTDRVCVGSSRLQTRRAR